MISASVRGPHLTHCCCCTHYFAAPLCFPVKPGLLCPAETKVFLVLDHVSKGRAARQHLGLGEMDKRTIERHGMEATLKRPAANQMPIQHQKRMRTSSTEEKGKKHPRIYDVVTFR